MQTTASSGTIYTLHFNNGLLEYYTAPKPSKYQYEANSLFSGTVYYTDPSDGKDYEITFSRGKVSSYYELVTEYSLQAPSSSYYMSGYYETAGEYQGDYRIRFSSGRYSSYEVWEEGGMESVSYAYIDGYRFRSIYEIYGRFTVRSNSYGDWLETSSTIYCTLNGRRGNYYFATDYDSGVSSGTQWADCYYYRQSSWDSTESLYGEIEGDGYYVDEYGAYELTESGWTDYLGIKSVSDEVYMYELDTETGNISRIESGGYFRLDTGTYHYNSGTQVSLNSNRYVEFNIGRSYYYYYNGRFYEREPSVTGGGTSHGDSVTGSARWVQGQCYYYLIDENTGELVTNGQSGNARLRFGNSASQAYSWWDGSNYNTTYPLQEIDYIRFSFLRNNSPTGSTKTLYYCLDEYGNNVVCSTAPTVVAVEQGGTENIYIGQETTPNASDRTFYFNATQADGSTSLNGSPNGRTTYSNGGNSSMLFRINGTLQMVGNYTATGIVRIKYSNENGTSGGAVFANGYLIKNGCDTL